MKKLPWKLKGGRAGTSLVEVTAAMLLFSIMMAMIVGIMSPAAKIFLQMRELEDAQIILDNIEQELRGIGQTVSGYIKIYENGNAVLEQEGSADGAVLEFINEQGYVTLLSADGCSGTDLMLGDSRLDVLEETDPGELLIRYYTRDAADGSYIYQNEEDAVARAGNKIFTDGYYMGNYLKMVFSYPENVSEGDKVMFVNVDLKLYKDKDFKELAVCDQMVMDFRYDAKRQDAVTAIKKI